MVRACSIYISTFDKLEQTLAGKILLDGKKIRLEPVKGHMLLLKNIYKESVYMKGKQLSSDDDPEKWFEGLPYQYSGSAVRAEITGGKNE